MGLLSLLWTVLGLLPSLMWHVCFTLPWRWLSDRFRGAAERQRRAARARRKSVAEAGSGLYGLAHRALNFEDPMHESMWLNMGLWRGAHTFVGACEDLADLVARAARVGPGSRVFEAGSGCGDSSFHILTAFRARSVFAVTLEPVQHYVAVNRSRKLGLEAGTNFLFGDAADPNDWTPTPIEAWENTFDAAISVDAAYHFETRQKFLQLVFDRILRPGGRFAAADIVAGPGFRDYLGDGTAGHPVFRDALQYAFRAAHLPYENLWDGPREYEERLRRIGFAEVRAEDISEDVFPGFVRFLDRFAEAWSPSGFEERLEVLYFAAVRELIRFLHQKRVLAFVLVSGRKPVEAA